MSLKSKTFEKLANAVDKADETTPDGVEILAMAASAVRNLNEGTDTEEDIYQIGTPGEIGFGVATCPAHLIPSGWRGLEGHDNIMSPNYGNYVDANGSILVYVPKHYYKWDGNTLYISHRPKNGYVIDRAYINGGKEVNGVFVYKYGCGNVNGILVSKKGLDPVSSSPDHNPVANINGCSENNHGEFYQAVKSAGSGYFITSVFIYSMLARLSFAHGKAATNQVACAYSDVVPFLPKGCNNSALSDANDSSVTFSHSGYSNCALTGSGEPFAKTTHNGQDCGIADLNGNMGEIASGFIRTDVDGFLVLKESVDITAIQDDGTTGGAYDTSLYDVVDIGDVVGGNDGWIKFGNGANAVFAMDTNRTSAAYKRTSIGIPTQNGVSIDGTIEFGSDGLYRYLYDRMVCLVGLYWARFSNSGVFALDLGNTLSGSGASVGARASYLV